MGVIEFYAHSKVLRGHKKYECLCNWNVWRWTTSERISWSWRRVALVGPKKGLDTARIPISFSMMCLQKWIYAKRIIAHMPIFFLSRSREWLDFILYPIWQRSPEILFEMRGKFYAYKLKPICWNAIRGFYLEDFYNGFSNRESREGWQ
jgi:hypothetical protein